MEFIKRFIKKTKPEDITIDDIKAFVDCRIQEGQNLEYKPRGFLVNKDNVPNTTPQTISTCLPTVRPTLSIFK